MNKLAPIPGRTGHGRAAPMAPRLEETLQARVGLALASRLSQSAEQLPHAHAQRLRVGRERALDAARAAAQRQASRAAAGATATVGGRGGAAWLGQGPSWGWRLAAWAPLLLLVVGLFGIGQYHERQQIVAAAEIDAALLADELSPEVLSDPGFREYLRMQSSP